MTLPNLDLLLLMTQPPLTASTAKEGLDLALVSATFEQKTGLAFVGSGVLQLLPDQQPGQLHLKGIQAMLKALPLYDVEWVFTDAQALADYQLDSDALLLTTQVASSEQLQELMAQARQTLVF